MSKPKLFIFQQILLFSIAISCISLSANIGKHAKKIFTENLVDESNPHDTDSIALYLGFMSITPNDRAVSYSTSYFQKPENHTAYNVSVIHRHSGIGINYIATDNEKDSFETPASVFTFKPSYQALMLVKDYEITRFFSDHLAIIGRVGAGMAKPKIKVVNTVGGAELATLKPKNMSMLSGSLRAEYGFTNTNMLIHSHSKAPSLLAFFEYGVNHFSKKNIEINYDSSPLSFKTAESFFNVGLSVTLF